MTSNRSFFCREKTLGQLIKELERGGVGENLSAFLSDALDARNFLMHHFFTWHAEDYLTVEGRGRMLTEVQKLRFPLIRAQTVFSQVREQFIEQLFGVSKEQLKQLHDDFVRQQRDA